MTQQALPKVANFGDLNLRQGTNCGIDLQVISIGEIKRVGQKGTPCQKCQLLDQTGQQSECTIWMGRTGTALADMHLNQWLTFNLSASNYRNKMQYSGFWQMEAPVIKTQNDPKAPVNPVARTIAKEPDWDAIAEGKVRHGVVCAFIQAGKFDVDISIVDYWVRYIIDGTVQAEEPVSPEVCPSCQLLRVDCTCPTEPFVR